jgi:hypothetical protein
MSDEKAYQNEMLLRGYKYLYYRIYAWNLRMWGESDLPQYNALFAVFILTFLNLMTIPTAIDVFTGGHLIKDTRANKLILGGLLFAIFLMVYSVLVHGKNYRKIAEQFSGETPTQKKVRLVFILAYIIGTFALFFGLMALRDS